MRQRIHRTPEQDAASDERCLICGGELEERKLKAFCMRCGQLARTCCDPDPRGAE